MAEWLSGEGLLVFDDEPEKAYSAKVVGGISIEQIAVTGTCEVRFLCKPFAESLRYNQQDVKSVSLPHTGGGQRPRDAGNGRLNLYHGAR